MRSHFRQSIAAMLVCLLVFDAGSASRFRARSSRHNRATGAGSFLEQALAYRPRWVGMLPHGSAVFHGTPPVPSPASAISASQDPYAEAFEHIERAREAENPNNKLLGYEVIIIASSDKDDQAIQEKHFQKAFGHQRTIVAVHLPLSGGGPLLDTLRAFRLACAKMPKLIDWWKEGKKIALILNAGKGIRDEPVTSAEFRSRGAIKLGGNITAGSGDPVPRTITNTAYIQSSEFADPLGDYFDVYYANQVYVPYEHNWERPTAPFVKQATEILSPDEMTEDTILECGVFEKDAQGRLIRNVPARFFTTVKEAQKWLEAVKRKAGHRAYFSLGSHRYRRDLLLAIFERFHDRLDDPSLIRNPPDFVNALLRLADCLDAVPGAVDQTNVDGMISAIRQGAPALHADLIKQVMHRDVIALYLQLRGREGFGRDPRDWVGLMDMSVFWWRYRRPLHLLNNQLLMLSDLTTGDKLQIEETGLVVTRPATSRDKAEARAARRVRGIDFPVQNCNLGGIRVNAEGRVPAGTIIYVGDQRAVGKTQITEEDIRLGIKIGKVVIKGSVVIDSELAPYSRVINSVVDHRHGKTTCDASFVVWSSGEYLDATNALVYGVVNRADLTVTGRGVADVFRAGLQEDEARELNPGQARMWFGFNVYSDLIDTQVSSGNRYSTFYLREGTQRNTPADLSARKESEAPYLGSKADKTRGMGRAEVEKAEKERRILVIGTGFVGKKLAATARKYYRHVQTASLSPADGRVDHTQLDYTSEEQVRACLEKCRPDVILFAAGEAHVDLAEKNEARAMALNADPVDTFATYFHGTFVYYSTEYVYDGKRKELYTPDMPPTPMNAYGRSHVQGEENVARALALGKEHPGEGFQHALVIRSSILYGYNDDSDRDTFVRDVVRALDRGEPMTVDNLHSKRPVDLDTLAEVTMENIRNHVSATVHVGGLEPVTKWEWAKLIATIYHRIFPHSFEMTLADIVARLIIGRPEPQLAKRPIDAGLQSSIPIPFLADRLRSLIPMLSDRLADGSYSLSRKVKTRDGSMIIRKQALSGGEARIRNEIRYLLALPEELRVHFPRVLDYSLEPGSVFYTMPYSPMQTMANLIMDEGTDALTILNKLDPILEFFSKQLILYGQTPDVPPRYAVNFLADKILNRISEVLDKVPEVFQDIVAADELIINGASAVNLFPLLAKIESDKDLVRLLQPPYSARIGGNMDFSNIFVAPGSDANSNGQFILGDVRGGEPLDPMYDVAKLLMPLVGNFDVLVRDYAQTTVEKTTKGISISLSFPMGFKHEKVYTALLRSLPELLYPFYKVNFSSRDPYWVHRLAYTVAAHFASEVPFQLKGDGTEPRAVAIYATAVLLMNEFLDFAYGKRTSYHGLHASPLPRAA